MLGYTGRVIRLMGLVWGLGWWNVGSGDMMYFVAAAGNYGNAGRMISSIATWV